MFSYVYGVGSGIVSEYILGMERWGICCCTDDTEDMNCQLYNLSRYIKTTSKVVIKMEFPSSAGLRVFF